MNLCEFVSIRKALFLPLRATQEWGEISPKISRIEPMNRRKTSNTQHPTSNNQWFPIGPLIGGWVLDVGWTALRTLVAAGLAIAIEFCPVAQASERYLNVLFIVIDDLND